MNAGSLPPARPRRPDGTPPATFMERMRRGRWGTSILLGIVLFVVYCANRHEIGAGDTIPATLLPVAILRGDGLALNRFAGLWDGHLPWYVTTKRGEIVSRYPLTAALLALPLTLPQLVVLDRMHPGWEQQAPYQYAALMGKHSAALLAALTGIALFQLLGMLGLDRVALLTTIIACLGSTLWAVGSQALWQHGPVALALTLALALLVPARVGRVRLLLAGAATGIIFSARPQNIVLALPIALWVVWKYRRQAIWFLPPPVVLGAVVVAINYWYFGTATGGYREIEPLALQSHNISGYWTADLIGGAAGTLLSPSHGLFIFSPWTALALACLPATRANIARWPLVRVAVWSLVPFFILLSAFAAWWAGWSFGPRYCTDVIPLFAVLLGFALAWSRQRCRPVFAAFLAAGAFSIAIELLGAFCFPSSWNAQPVDVNRAHERLWDWRDSELTRCLRECPQRLW
jgi:hypothetical protein